MIKTFTLILIVLQTLLIINVAVNMPTLSIVKEKLTINVYVMILFFMMIVNLMFMFVLKIKVITNVNV